MGQDMKSERWKRLRARRLDAARRVNEPCAACGQPLDFDAPPRTRWSASVDHALPRANGGGVFDWRNLQPMHYGCNARKGARMESLGNPVSQCW